MGPPVAPPGAPAAVGLWARGTAALTIRMMWCFGGLGVVFERANTSKLPMGVRQMMHNPSPPSAGVVTRFAHCSHRQACLRPRQ